MIERPSRRHRGPALATGLVLLALAVLVSCSSDESNPVGVGLGTAGLDTLLQEFELDSLVHLGRLDIENPVQPLDEADVLYLGERLGDTSSILANFDFGDIGSYQYTIGDSVVADLDFALIAELLATAAPIDKIDLLLQTVEWYKAGHGPMGDEDNQRPWPEITKDFDVHRLTAPFDTLTYPAAEPAHEGTDLASGAVDQPLDGPVELRLTAETVLGWLDGREELGVIIREPATSPDRELAGFVSRESANIQDSLLEQSLAGTKLGPTIRIELRSDEFLFVSPTADVSTWHALADLPSGTDADIVLRSHLISSVLLRFDLEALPERVRINRANLVLHVDTARTYGPSTRLELSELPTELAPSGSRTRVIDDDVEVDSEFLSNGILDPEHLSDHTVRLALTSTVQRFINGLPDDEVGYLLGHSDRSFPGTITVVDQDGVARNQVNTGSLSPRTFMQRWTFHGPDASPELRPRLEVLYTRIDELTDGEAR